MRIEKFYTQMSYFRDSFQRKYNCDFYNRKHDKNSPTVFYGCYGKLIQNIIKRHRGFAVIRWAGSDAMELTNFPEFIKFLRRNENRIFHIASSKWVKEDLKKARLKFYDIPVFATEFDPAQFKLMPLGDCVYHYTSSRVERQSFYGTDKILNIAKGLAHDHTLSGKFMIKTVKDHQRSEIHEFYARCFMGVRLTPHDGLGTSCFEMALMGRRSIFNGEIPGAIHFNEQTDILQLMMNEQQREEPDKEVAEETWDLINQDQGQWLNTKFYS